MSGLRHIAFVGHGPHLHFWAGLLSEVNVRVDLIETRRHESDWPYGEVLSRWSSHSNPSLPAKFLSTRRAMSSVRSCQGPQLIHAHYLGKPAWIASRANRPLVASAWGTDISASGDEFASWWRRWMTLRALRRFQAITAHSASLVDRLIQIGQPRERVHLIPWGTDTSVFCHQGPATWRDRLDAGGGPLLLSLRWSDPIYQTLEIVRAFARPRSYAGLVREEVERLGVSGRVRWVPWLETTEEMADLYRSCDLGISYPTEDGMPLSVREAMCCGLGLIVSRLANLENLVEHGVNGWTVDPESPEQLSETLHGVLADATASARVRGTLRSFADEVVSPQQGRDHLLDLYGRVIAEQGQR